MVRKRSAPPRGPATESNAQDTPAREPSAAAEAPAPARNVAQGPETREASAADTPEPVASGELEVDVDGDGDGTTVGDGSDGDDDAADAGEGSGLPPREYPGPARTAPRSVSETHLKGIIESLVFVSDKPLTVSDLGRIARAELRDVRRLLGELREEYRGRGVQLDEIAGGWQFRSSAANAPFVRELLQAKPVRLTRAQIETLAIVAYRQPITRPEIDDIRGVDSGSALKLLLDRDLIRILGRKEEVGRPVLYGTTGHFLEFFGLKSLRDLPTLREFTDLTPESAATLVRELGDDEGAGDDAMNSERPAATAAQTAAFEDISGLADDP